MIRDFDSSDFSQVRNWPILAKAYMGLCTPSDAVHLGVIELLSPDNFYKVVFYT